MRKIILMFILFSFSSARTHNMDYVNENVSKKEFYEYIKTKPYPKIHEWVFKQAMLESGHLNSILARRYNNFFGMKNPKKRETLSVGKTRSNYAIFKKWEHSIDDYFIWLELKPPKENESFGDYINRRKYHQSDKERYLNTLRKIKCP